MNNIPYDILLRILQYGIQTDSELDTCLKVLNNGYGIVCATKYRDNNGKFCNVAGIHLPRHQYLLDNYPKVFTKLNDGSTSVYDVNTGELVKVLIQEYEEIEL